jgi:aminoglycoside phosphotransferase (APT) family kinase protein
MTAGKMHADEVETDASLVGRLLAAHFLQWPDLPIQPVPSAGTDNALYRLGDDMVVRLPRIKWAVESLDKEHRWLPRLAPLLPVAIPVPLGKGTPAEGYPWHWSIYRWLEGENPTVDRLADPGLLARDLAEFVAALRRIDPTDGPQRAPGDAGRSDALRDRSPARNGRH